MSNETNQKENNNVPQKTNMEMPILLVNGIAKKLITDLCDIALKVGGLKNLDGINILLSSMRPLPNNPSTPEDKKGD